jgi:hypothetical protein
MSARLRDAASAGNCRAVGVTAAGLQGVRSLLGRRESYRSKVGVDVVHVHVAVANATVSIGSTVLLL